MAGPKAFTPKNGLGLRKCHTPGCDNMTTDFRCKACWLKMQGFDPNSKSDQGIIESGGAKSSRRHSTRPD